MTAVGWERSVQRVLGNDVSVGPHGLSVLIPCKGPCAGVVTFATPKVMSPEGLRRKLEVEGWRLGSRRQCPKCNAPKAQSKEKVSVSDKSTLMTAAAPRAMAAATPPAQSPTDAARAVRRAVIQWLEEAYDVGKSAYRAGVTDDSIAKETGAAVALVKQLREENYGPLAMPSEVAELLAEMSAIRREGTEARELLDTKLSALNGRQTAVEQKLERLAKANGWPL